MLFILIIKTFKFSYIENILIANVFLLKVQYVYLNINILGIKSSQMNLTLQP